jgi:predicted Ser/Thr protein kinase
MTPEQWAQVKGIFAQAIEMDRGSVNEFLAAACSGNAELRLEVDQLLHQYENVGSFLERGVIPGILARLPVGETTTTLTLSADARRLLGTVIAGRYEVETLLGRGGMGLVYRGFDKRLMRSVALKFLSTEKRPDPEHVQRLLIEARSASGLNHPNVAQIYDIGEADGEPFIAMEYVEGRSLDSVISGRRLQTLEILEIAIQVAAGLSEAHQKGITHRDIKPSNIMVTGRGGVKIVDFGLAKIERYQLGEDSTTTSINALTEPGVIAGTVQYMSPEQALGHQVDPRTDIFSLGVVLYEMTTGRQPFKGTSLTETIDRILHGEPERVSSRNSDAFSGLSGIILKCLQKDREKRYQFASELLDDLLNLTKSGDPRHLLKNPPPKHQRRPAVYVAPDFRPATDKLRASLQHHFEVLPADPMELLGLCPKELEASLERDFARCFVSVHPLSDAPFTKPLIQAHIEFAQKRNKPRLVWTPERPDHLTNAGFEWFTSPSEIEDWIRRLHNKPPIAKPAGTGGLIYFLCPDRANKALAEPLLKRLEHGGIYVYASPLEGPAELALQTHMSALDELDGCLIYYGDVDRSWFDAVFLRVQKKIRQRRLPIAIYVAPPPTEHKTNDLWNLGVPVLQEPEATVQAFIGGIT